VLEENIHRAVEDVDDSYTADCDGIPAYFLKHCIEMLCVPLKILFDKSLSSGHFADRWKVAFVTPILKSVFYLTMKYQANRQENNAALKVTIYLRIRRWTMLP